MADEFISAFENAWFYQHTRWCQAYDLNGAMAYSHESAAIPFFHRVSRVKVDESDADRLIDDAIRFFDQRNFDCVFTLSPLDRPTNFAEHLRRRGFSEGVLSSAMVFSAEDPPTAQSKAEVDVVGAEDYDDWANVMCRSFEQPSEKGVLGRSVLMTPDDHLYLARVDGKPAGSTQLLSRGDMGYIDFVGVLPQYRRRGVASVLVTRAAADSQQMGKRWTTLETATGSNAERLYQTLGFRIEYHRPRFSKTR